MAKKQNNILMILSVLITIIVAFWVGRQSVVQSGDIATETIAINNISDSTASTTNSVEIATVEVESSSTPETLVQAEEAVQEEDTAQEEAAEQTDVVPVQESTDTELDADAKRLLADIDLAGIDLETLQIYLKAWELLDQDFYGEKPEGNQRLYASIRGLLESYDDPYTFFIEPQTNKVERGNLRGQFGGIGAYVEIADAGFTLRPMRDQPAARAGVQENDLLIAVDDTIITADMAVDKVVSSIRGPVDTDINITVLRAAALEVNSEDSNQDDSESAPSDNFNNAEELTFTITRAEIQTPSMDWHLLSTEQFPSAQWKNPEDIERINTIGYIRHHIFSDRSPIEMRTALDELRENSAEYFILDLRGNPGGPVNAVIQTADLWLESGGIMREVNAQGEERLFEATAEVAVDDEPLIIMIDGGSASASEILAGALQDHDRATLLGEKTFGKGSVQIIYPLPDDSSVHITNAIWLTPDGNVINKQGLNPDILIEPGTDPLPQSIGALLDLDWKALPPAEVVEE